MEKYLKSSVDPQKMSTTIRGGVLACSVLILAGARALGVPFTEADVVMFATQLGGVVSGIIILYGLVWKVIMSLKK